MTGRLAQLLDYDGLRRLVSAYATRDSLTDVTRLPTDATTHRHARGTLDAG